MVPPTLKREVGRYIASPCETPMTQRRVTATNQLSTVVDALQLGGKTGILTVERGEGETFEEGMIMFVNGQVVNAVIGPYSGRDAATKLFSWQACRFSFTPLPQEQVDAGQWGFAVPANQAETQEAGPSLPGPLNRGQQGYPPAQNRLSRRPFLTAYPHETLGNILRALERQGFSRAHRRLFLLIDGRRSVQELAALISRTPDETLSLLDDLERSGVIKV